MQLLQSSEANYHPKKYAFNYQVPQVQIYSTGTLFCEDISVCEWARNSVSQMQSVVKMSDS